MKTFLFTTSIVTLFVLVLVNNNASTVETDPHYLNRKLSPVPSGSALTKHYYEIDKIKREIEMLECDRVFTVRPDHVIQKELESAHARLKQITQLPK